MSAPATGATVTIDDLVGGLYISCPTLTALITAATDAQKTALADELNAILAANPEDATFASLTVTGAAAVQGGLVADEVEIDTGTKTASATAGAATLNKSSGVITSEALTTAAGADYTLTLTDNKIAAGDIVLANVFNGTNTGGTPAITTSTSGAGSATIIVQNIHATDAFNGTIKIGFVVVKAGTPT